MIANTNLFSGPYPTNGVLTTFPVTFTFLQNSDLVVLLINSSTGVITTLVLNVDYTVVGAGQQNGGTLTTTAVYPTGSTIVIIRGMAYVQDSQLENQGSFAFYASTIEGDDDYLTLLVQQLAEQLGRCFKTAPGTQPANYTPISGSVAGLLSFPIPHPTLAGAQITAEATGWGFRFNGVLVALISASGIKTYT